MRRTTLTLAVILLPLLTACSMFFANTMRIGSSSSLVEFLYPDGKIWGQSKNP